MEMGRMETRSSLNDLAVVLSNICCEGTKEGIGGNSSPSAVGGGGSIADRSAGSGGCIWKTEFTLSEAILANHDLKTELTPLSFGWVTEEECAGSTRIVILYLMHVRMIGNEIREECPSRSKRIFFLSAPI